uniref:Uncharacterized protein n=1 Tax=Plectus sambesii TaxID=2011161 RepID=A0A914VP85_9BILA
MDPAKLGFGEKVVTLTVYSYLVFKLLNTYIALTLLVGSFTAIY